MCFLREPWLRGIVEEACRAEGLEPFGWRDVPTRRRRARLDGDREHAADRAARARARAREPDAELRAHRARRRAERVEGVYVASLSFRTVTYKALCAATQLASFYPDLADPDWAASWAIFHQRFSTNTEPSWERAQPFRLLCHNGEINTIDGNVAWMEARERARGVDPELAPALDRSGSDSALLDNALELLVRAGLDVREAVTLLVPPAWQNDPRIDEQAARDAPLPRDAGRAVGRSRRARLLGRRRRAARRSTGTACARCASPCATTASSPSRRRRARSRSRRASPCAAPGSAPASSSRSTPSAACSSTAS